MTRIFLFLISFGLIIISLSNIILYMNLVTIGYNFIDYVKFIISKSEFYILIISLITLILTLWIKGEKSDELYI